jgi:hypothetical protein
MNRLYHSPAAFRRYMEMSSTQMFIFVEGKETDAFFYDRICVAVCNGAGVKHEIVRANRFAASGGKQVLLSLFRALDGSGGLSGKSGDETWSCLFYLDKDVDDVLHQALCSPHIVYTPFYTVENALFMYGDVIRAAAAASSLELRKIEARIRESRTWRLTVAGVWKEFTALCLFGQKYGLACDCRYGRNVSPLNAPPEAPADSREVAMRLNELQAEMGCDTAVFSRRWRATLRLVKRLHSTGHHDVVFNGKWYFELLRREVELAAGAESYSNQFLNQKIRTALAATIDFDGSWSEHFRQPLRRLLETLRTRDITTDESCGDR